MYFLNNNHWNTTFTDTTFIAFALEFSEFLDCDGSAGKIFGANVENESFLI